MGEGEESEDQEGVVGLQVERGEEGGREDGEGGARDGGGGEMGVAEEMKGEAGGEEGGKECERGWGCVLGEGGR